MAFKSSILEGQKEKELSHLNTGQGYIPSLEGCRGVAAFMVALYHFYGFFADTQFATSGYLAVDFFFILSGFIIARQYEPSIAGRKLNFSTFAIRRLARLYPLYIFSIALFLVINIVYLKPNNILNAIDFGMGPRFLWNIILQLTMFTNIGGMAAPWNSPAWSVSVEWVVNLLFFFGVWKMRGMPNFLLWALTLLCSLYLINVTPKTLNAAIADQAFFNVTIARGIVGFSLGVLIYHYLQNLPVLLGRRLLVIEAIVFILTVFLLHVHEYLFVDYALQLLLFPALIIVMLYKDSWVGKCFALAPFTFLGRISYSIYLLHLPLGYIYKYSGYFETVDKPYYGFLFIVLMLIACTLSYELLEKPARKLGRKLAGG